MRHFLLPFAALCFCATAGSQPVEDLCLRHGLKRFVSSCGGRPLEGDFTLLEWVVPPALPSDAEVPMRVSFVRTRADTGSSLSAAVVGDWGKAAVWPLRVNAKAAAGDTLAGVVIIKTPAQSGQHRLRLMLRELPRKQKDLPFAFGGCCERCVWSEIVVSVIDLDQPRPLPVPAEGVVTQTVPARPRMEPGGTALPDSVRRSQKALLDSMRSAGIISDMDYRMKMEYLGY